MQTKDLEVTPSGCGVTFSFPVWVCMGVACLGGKSIECLLVFSFWFVCLCSLNSKVGASNSQGLCQHVGSLSWLGVCLAHSQVYRQKILCAEYCVCPYRFPFILFHPEFCPRRLTSMDPLAPYLLCSGWVWPKGGTERQPRDRRQKRGYSIQTSGSVFAWTAIWQGLYFLNTTAPLQRLSSHDFCCIPVAPSDLKNYF